MDGITRFTEQVKGLEATIEAPTSKTMLLVKPTQTLADSQFPDIMSGLAGDFANLYSTYLETPKHFLFLSFLACLGSVVSNRLTLKSEIAPQPRLYLLLLGQSADERKSTAIVKAAGFFKEAMTDFAVSWGVGSAEGLQKHLEDNPLLLLIYDEFKACVSKCKIEGSVLLPMLTTLFEKNEYESRTKNSHILCLFR